MNGLKYSAAGFVGHAVLQSIFSTVRFRVETPEPFRNKPVIFALWHGRLLPLLYHHRYQGVTGLVSRSADGEYLARILQSWGFEVARGSSSRGGMPALREVVRIARSGGSIAITPDGPRGPRQKMKQGVLTAAQLSGLPLLPVSAAATRAWWFEGWDRFLVPKPFATVYVRYGDLIEVPRDATPADLAALEQRVENKINELTLQTDADARK